jgi:hypothetical protein
VRKQIAMSLAGILLAAIALGACSEPPPPSEANLQPSYERCIAKEAVKLTSDGDPDDRTAMTLVQGTCQSSNSKWDEAFGANEFSRQRVVALMEEIRSK